MEREMDDPLTKRRSRLFSSITGDLNRSTKTQYFKHIMADTFQNHFKTASNIVKNINSILSSIQDNPNLSETQKQVGRAKQYFEQAQEALKIMRTTASTLPYNNKIQAMGHVRNIEQSLATIKKEITRWDQKVNKASLMGPVGVCF